MGGIVLACARVHLRYSNRVRTTPNQTSSINKDVDIPTICEGLLAESPSLVLDN